VSGGKEEGKGKKGADFKNLFLKKIKFKNTYCTFTQFTFV